MNRVDIIIVVKRCLGCGMCMDMSPDLFKLNNKHSEYIGGQVVNDKELSDVSACEVSCPVRAITVSRLLKP